MGRLSYVDDGDIGCDVPGTPRWHLCHIAQIEDAEIVAYIQAALGVILEGEDIRKQAEAAIRESS